MTSYFIAGGIAGWLLVSFLSGRLLPALDWRTIVAVFVGGIIGQVVGLMLSATQGGDGSSKEE